MRKIVRIKNPRENLHYFGFKLNVHPLLATVCGAAQSTCTFADSNADKLNASASRSEKGGLSDIENDEQKRDRKKHSTSGQLEQNFIS